MQQHAPSRRRHRQHTSRADHSGAIFIIGLLFLLVIGNFWPGILVLLGLTRFVKHTARGRSNLALSKLVFWVGLAALWYTPFLWPGVLLLLFASHMIGRQQHITWI